MIVADGAAMCIGQMVRMANAVPAVIEASMDCCARSALGSAQ